MTKNELKTMIKRYKKIEAWKKNTYFSEKEFEHMEDILLEAKTIDKKVPYKDLVDTSFSKNE